VGRIAARHMKSCLISLLQPIVVVKSIKIIDLQRLFFALVQRYAITAPKQLAMAVAAWMVVGDPIAVAHAKAILGAIAASIAWLEMEIILLPTKWM
jgi:hypothetical protein